MVSAWSLGDLFSWTCGNELFILGNSCAQRRLIDVVNLAFVVISVLGFLISYFRREDHHGRKNRSWDCLITSLLCAALSISCFSLSFWVLIGGSSSLFQLNWLVCFVRGIIWISLAFSLYIYHPKWLRTILLSWWITFSVLITVFNLEMVVRGSGFQILDLISWPVNLLLVFCAFKRSVRTRLNENSESDNLSSPLLLDRNEKRTNSSKAGVFSWLTFSWLNPLLRLGSSKPLALEDIPALDSEDEAFLAYKTFYRAWEFERGNRSITRNLVLISLAKCYSKEMLLVGLYALLKSLSVAASPLILYTFIVFSNQEEKNLKFGFFLIICLAFLKLVDSISQRHWFFDSRRFGMRMRSGVMAAIFQKQLRLSSQGRRRHSIGEIVNYIAVDAYRLGEFPWWFHMAWSSPLQILLSIVVLIMTVGVGALPGLIPLIIFGFLNVPIAKIMQYYQTQFMLAQDERLRATSEVLNNMKIIKLQSWEEMFRKMIQSLRDKEFKWLREIQITKSYGTALYWMAPTVVSAVIFAGTAALKSASLNASTIFTVLATLRVMSEPVRMLPEALLVIIQVKVSLDRINVFLLEDEIKEEDVLRNTLNNANNSIQVHNGYFSWDIDATISALKNINLDIRKGQKIAVCGPVGAGKSSLIYALLGEISKVSGSVSVFGTIAYVSQTSWIQSGTIRDNILFGKPMNKERYDMAVSCCALDKDIENFVHGDLAEIGQRGLNMSGGQKQRIQLARAVYSDADNYLLDDPFSAVDAHTAAILFHDYVMSALENKTVILVTHQVEFLAEADGVLEPMRSF